MSIAGGELGISHPQVNDFLSVTLDGTARSSVSSIEPFMVTDARGTGAGWEVSIQASQFREWDEGGYLAEARDLPLGSLALSDVSVSPQGTDSAVATVPSGPLVIDGRATSLAAAAPGTGMGSYVFTVGELTLTVPAGAYAARYRSEIAISVTSGP